jgi:prepilin-type N-terminal cleavage/methylation domain-containing protein/prepilin-type processing-associated H-X9-DG protein
MKSRRSAFTLVELLVVIAIIGILIALLLPAVQAAREAARRAQCSNNLKQIGLALQNYHDSFKEFPPACALSRGGAAPVTGNGYAQWGWGAMILPFMEQQSVHDALSVGIVHLADSVTANPAVVQTPIANLRCPSDTGPDLNSGRPIAGIELALSSYVGAQTSWAWRLDQPLATNQENERGCFIENKGTKIRDIIDGTSNTIAVGERRWQYRATDGTIATARSAIILGMNSPSTGATGRADQVGIGMAKLNFTDPITWKARQGFSSMHPGGAQFVFADGSTHFIAETIEMGPDTDGDQWADVRDSARANPVTDISVYERLIAIADGMPVSEF